MDFSPKCYFFCECKSDRIGQNIQNEVLLKRSIFEEVNVYQFIPCKQRPSIFLDKLGRLEERCVTRRKTATILEPQTNRVSRNQRFLHSPLERILRNDLFLDLFLEKHSSNHSHNSKRNDQQHLHIHVQIE